MCGAGLLGRQRRGPGAHHYSWQGHVHRHPVQGKTHRGTGRADGIQESRPCLLFYLYIDSFSIALPEMRAEDAGREDTLTNVF